MLRGIGNLIILIIDLIFGGILILLLLRILFRLFGADPRAEFSQFIYNNTNFFVEPFAGVFQPVILGDNNFLEFGAIFSFFLILFIVVIITEIVSSMTGSNLTVYKIVRRAD